MTKKSRYFIPLIAALVATTLLPIAPSQADAASPVDALDTVRRTLAERVIVFALARVKFEVREILASTGFIERIGEDKVFMTLPTAVGAYQQWNAARRGGDAPSAEA